ncbi:transporter substrate-binding domain-containing protein [Rouxiella sp. Mn2063]|uniref:transporter substrate-binding domain-containing protein n=1 Tax=Rouxiella sp. Mn2063 TaxID=3395262 RepID=UPI003BDBC98E
MLRHLFILLLTLSTLVNGAAYAATSQAAETGQSLMLYSRQAQPDLTFHLSGEDWRWLGLKKEITVATWEPQNQPMDIVVAPATFEGISADYLNIISRQLGVQPKILRFDSRMAALMAVSSGEADMMIDDHGSPDIDTQRYAASQSYLPNHPALVAKEANGMHLPQPGKPFSLVVAKDYLSDQQIKQLYPQAEITRFPSSQSTISALAYRHYDYMLGNMANVSFFIDRNYSNSLSVLSVSPALDAGARFIMRRDDEVLLRSVNTVLAAMTPLQQDAIINSWFLGADFFFLHQSVRLSEPEQAWIKEHPVVKVIANPFYAPISMRDANGGFHGISLDVLHLVSLRTGIQFEMVAEDHVGGMTDALTSHQGEMIAAMSFSQSRADKMTFTRPYLFAPFVLVVRNTPEAPSELGGTMRVAVAQDNLVQEQYAKKYPNIQWIETANASLAMKLVQEGKADAAIHVQTGASFMIDRYFPGQLKIAARVGDQTDTVSFAVSKDQRELESILNKTLADIPPRAYAKIFNKWQGSPEVPLETWKMYSTQYYVMFALAGVLVLSTLLWAFWLRRAMKVKQKAQDALLLQLNFRDALLNGSPTPIYVIDRHGKVISQNQAFNHFFKVVPPENMALPLFDQRHPLSPLLPTLQPLLQQSAGAEDRPHQRFTLFNGTENRIIAHWTKVFNNKRGSIDRLICGWQDITAHEALLLEVSAEKDNAEQASRAKGSFLATMSHEIRTPVSAIIGLLELAESSRTADTPDGEALRLAYTSAQSLIELIGDVLDVAKIESGNLDLSPQWVQPGQVCASVVHIFEGLVKQKGLALSWQNTLSNEFDVWLDAQRLKQVLNNYLSNAVKFTTQGTVGIQLSGERLSADRAKIEVIIHDTGVGISEEDRSKLFVPFSQLEAGKKQMGSGLGLVISAEIIQLMGGSYQFDSESGRGTRVIVTFEVPIRPAANQPDILNRDTQNGQRALRILIVDDHTTNRLLLRRQLEALGHEVIEAVNGELAYQRWQQEQVDLIITDCHMPVMDGIALTRAVRQTGRAVAIWGLTANAQAQERDACLAAGMDECFFKPLRMKPLNDALTRLAAGLFTAPPLETLIHFAEVYELAMNNESLLQQMLRQTQEENRQDLALASAAFAHRDWAAFTAVVHKLSGAAQIIGAESIGELAGMMEDNVRDAIDASDVPDADEIETDFVQLQQELGELDQAISDYLAGKASF